MIFLKNTWNEELETGTVGPNKIIELCCCVRDLRTGKDSGKKDFP